MKVKDLLAKSRYLDLKVEIYDKDEFFEDFLWSGFLEEIPEDIENEEVESFSVPKEENLKIFVPVSGYGIEI